MLGPVLAGPDAHFSLQWLVEDHDQGKCEFQLCDAAGCGRKLLNDFENGLVTPKVSKRTDMKAALERSGAVFARIGDIAAVGIRPGSAAARSARGRAFADEVEVSD